MTIYNYIIQVQRVDGTMITVREQEPRETPTTAIDIDYWEHYHLLEEGVISATVINIFTTEE